MTSIISLLTLPVTSKAFTALRVTAVDTSVDDGSASLPRKTPRLEADSDSGSAYRSRVQVQQTPEKSAPVRVVIENLPGKVLEDKSSDSLVRRSIKVLLTKDSNEDLPATYEDIYSACRTVVCVSKRGEGLYDGLKLELEQCVVRLANSLVQYSVDQDPIDWIHTFTETCRWFETQTALLKSLLTFLDQVYVIKHCNNKVDKIHTLAYSLFKNDIFVRPQIITGLRVGIKKWIAWERTDRSEHEQRVYIKELVSHLLTHGNYTEIFEYFYLEQTTAFYAAESLELSEALVNQAKEFLAQTSRRLDEEDKRSQDVLPQFTWNAVKKATETALLSERLDWLGKAAMDSLMEERNMLELSRMHQLFGGVGGMKVLCAAFKIYILNKVQNIVKDVDHDEYMVQNLLDFKKFIDGTLASAFVDEVKTPPANSGPSASKISITSLQKKRPNQEFTYALTDAFNTGFKARRNKPAEMIAKYLDRAMRKGQRGASDAEFEALLDNALALYRFTDDKDVFRTFYHRALSKRLLLERSASDDFEKAMLKKLKEGYDPEFGMGDHMFNDLALSRETMAEYHSRLPEQSSAHKLNVMVLQRSFWPFSARKSDVDLPPSMQADLTAFADFYKGKHKGHKLEFDHSLGTVTLKARFNAGPKDLSVSLYQAIVLLLFNDTTELPFKDILDYTRMADAELRRTLQSLACGNKKVLKKKPVGKDVDDLDVFYFNADFTDPRPRVHINAIQVKETAEESKRTQVSIEGDRKHYLDAAIVRIMKARKELSYEQLKVATVDAVKSHFVPEVIVIKQRIQSLVEQEYIRRDEDDMNLYIYVA